MDSTDPDSTCFAVGHLKQGLKGSKRTGIKAGTVKDFVVEKHLTVFRQGTQHHTRNFTFWWRWTHPNGFKTWKQVSTKAVKNKGSEGNRWDERLWSPLEKQSVSIVRLACMLKSRKYTSASIDGMNTDHNNGPDGWRVADWRRLRIIDAATDPDRGWFNPGL